MTESRSYLDPCEDRPVQTMAEVLERLSNYWEKNRDIRLALLNGSAARDQLGAHSDVDIAVATGTVMDSDRKARLQIELAELLGRDVDLIDLETLTGLLQEFLWADAVYLRQDPVLVERYTSRAQAFVEDIKPAMMRMIDYRLKKAFGRS